MTTVSADNLGSGGKRRKRTRPSWNRLWQVPLLLAGVTAFGFGVRALVKAYKPVPFATQAEGVRNLLADGKYDDAIKAINTLAAYYKTNSDQGELERLSGDAHYLAQQAQPAFVRENYEAVRDHYQQAVAQGVKPDATMNDRWGEAELALGDGAMALEKLQAAIAADPSKLNEHVHDLVSAYLASGNVTKAIANLDQLLAEKKQLSVDEKAWALCKKIEIAIGLGTADKLLQNAIDEARKHLPEMPERDPAGRVYLWMGRAEFEQGQLEAAQKDLTEARKCFVVHHLDDGRAAVLLGKIAEAKNDLETAAQLFDDVVMRDVGTSIWPAARLGRAEVLAIKNDPGEQMQEDYHFVIKTLQTPDEIPSIEDGSSSGSHHVPEMVRIAQVDASLVAQHQRYVDAGRYKDALLFLTLQKEIDEPETAERAFKLGDTKERRAQQLITEIDGISPSDVAARAAKRAEATSLLASAADDFVRHSRLTTMDDATSGNSLWHAAHLFDEAGQTMKAVNVYEKFTIERPRDSRTPEGLLNMGMLYQSVGMLDKAITVYQRNIKENSRTPSAYSSAVNLARCYMALGTGPGKEENFDKAEKSLLSLVQENSDLLPTANEFRISLFTLGELYYRNKHWADAVLRLEEAVARYPQDPSIPQAMFMLAESYRKSAGEIAAAIKANPGIEHREELQQARADRLARSASLFSRVISTLDVGGADAIAVDDSKLAPLQQEYLHASYMDRAESYYELGDYSTAIKLYDQAATRFAQSRIAIEAYVQIVNGYLAMGEKRQATAAAERAQWILKRIPDEAFAQGPVSANRKYYADFFNRLQLDSSTAGAAAAGG